MRYSPRFIVLCFILLASLLSVGPTACKTTEPAVRPSPSKLDARSRKIYDLVNQYRAAQGLKRLRADSFLNGLAAEHSRNMAAGKVALGHQDFGIRISAIEAKIRYKSIAENVGESMGRADPEEELVKGWLNSPSHLKNIKGNFDLTGIGVARKGKDDYYATQIFVKALQ